MRSSQVLSVLSGGLELFWRATGNAQAAAPINLCLQLLGLDDNVGEYDLELLYKDTKCLKLP